MPTDANKIYTPYLYGEEVAITTYPDDTIYTTDIKYNVYECERPYASIYGGTSLWYARHGAVDLAGKWHQELYAVEDATVIDCADWFGSPGSWGAESSGTYVALSINGCRGHEVVAIYKHLSSRYLNMGDVVAKGHGVGLQGGTGVEEFSFGEHLHFELWIDGKLNDPIPYLEDRKSFIIADPEPEVETSVNIAVIARYKYTDGGTQNIRADKSTNSADIGDITDGSDFDVDIISNNEGYTWGHIPNVGWTVLYKGDAAWCTPIAQIPDCTAQIDEKNRQILDLQNKYEATSDSLLIAETKIVNALEALR